MNIVSFPVIFISAEPYPRNKSYDDEREISLPLRFRANFGLKKSLRSMLPDTFKLFSALLSENKPSNIYATSENIGREIN